MEPLTFRLNVSPPDATGSTQSRYRFLENLFSLCSFGIISHIFTIWVTLFDLMNGSYVNELKNLPTGETLTDLQQVQGILTLF